MNDKDLIQTIQLTGDAYYYLLKGEEPLDPDNIDEVKELLSTLGEFDFISEPDPIRGTDMVEVKIALYDKHTLIGSYQAIFILSPTKGKVFVSIYNTNTNKYECYNSIEDLKPIGDAYWVHIRTNRDGSKDYLPICKIAEYEKWFGEN